MSSQSIHEFKEAMSTIKARGIVKTNILKSNAIYRYDFKSGEFKPYSMDKLYKLFNRLYLNSYDVKYSINQVFNELDAIDFKKVENYYKYQSAITKKYDFADLENQANHFLELNKENKKKIHTVFWKPASQLQNLFNHDVFSNGNLLCRYKPGGKYFDYIAPNNLMQFFRNMDNIKNLSAIELANNYGFFVDNLINIGGLYQELKDYRNNKRILTNCKSDYEYIKNIIDGFS